MDLRKLIAKMDKIESKKFLTESEKKADKDYDGDGKVETPKAEVWGSRMKAAKKKTEGKKSYNNEPDLKEVSADGAIKESLGIADALLESFGLSEQVANPYTGADAAKFAAMSPEDQAWLTKGGGKPDINDEFILSRAPNGGKPVQKPAAAPAAGASGQLAQPGKMPADLAAQMAKQTGASTAIPDTTGMGKAGPTKAAAAGMDPSNPLNQPKPAAAPAAGASGQPAAAAAKPAAAADPNVQNVQKQLIALGVDVGKTGADGKMGPATAGGIKAFQKMAGIPEDGKISPALTQALSKGQQIVNQNGLTNAITALEKILTKYKVESVTHPNDIDIMTEAEIRSFVMKNASMLSEIDRMTAMRLIVSEQSVVPAARGAMIGRQPEKFMGNAEIVGGGAPAGGAAQPSKLAQFGKNLASRMVGAGAGAKGLAKAGAKMGARLIPGVGFGLLAWDVIGAALDTLTSDPSIQLDPADKAEIEKHMPVLKKYLEDPQAAGGLPKELQTRLTNVNTRVQKLVGQGGGAAPAAQPAAPAAGASGQPASGAQQAGASVGGAIKAPFRAVGNAVSSGAKAVGDFAKGVWNAE